MAKKVRIYNRVKSVLAEKRKTSIWLADEINASQSTVSRWCRNDNQPELETLYRIAEILNVEARDLLVSMKDSIIESKKKRINKRR